MSRSANSSAWTFDGELLGLHVTGAFTAITPGSITLQTTSVTLNGIPVCSAGTYNLPRVGAGVPGQ